MSFDKQLASAIHTLLYMAEVRRPVTSTWLGEKLSCNAVTVRRLLKSLKELELVDSSKGHGGGWIIAKSPDQISMLDVYHALGCPRMFAMGNRKTDLANLNELDKTANCFIYDSLTAAELAFLEELEKCSLRQLYGKFRESCESDDWRPPL